MNLVSTVPPCHLLSGNMQYYTTNIILFFLKEVTSGRKFKSRINYSFLITKAASTLAFPPMAHFLSWIPDSMNSVNHWVPFTIWLKRYTEWQTHLFSSCLKKSSSKERNLLKPHWNSSFCWSIKMSILNCELRRRGWPGWHTLDMMPPFTWLSFSCLGDGHIKKKSWLLHIKFRELSIVY